MNARDLRLRNDYASLIRLCERSEGAIEIESKHGNPPDEYVLFYNCRSIERLNGDKPVYANGHRLRVRLPARYPLPSAPPRLELLTPLYNPHIYPNRQVCIGNWQTSEYLDELIARVGALIQFDRRILNLRDPANPEAMEWVKRNLRLLPTDNRLFGEAPEPTRESLPDALPDLSELARQQHFANDDIVWIDEEV